MGSESSRDEFEMDRSNRSLVNERSWKDESFEVLYDMLKEQMSLLEEQKRIQIEQANYSNSLI